MIKILHTDDDPIMRIWLKVIIKNFFPNCLIDEAEDGDSAFKKIKENEYQLIISDINMPQTDTFAFISSILALKPESKILMYSSNEEEEYAKQFLQLGAMGYLKKDAPQPEIKKAIDNCLNNKKYLSSSFIQVLNNGFNKNSDTVNFIAA
ncbi:MAG: response regulator transcription factor [Chitinophagaceae bacterium]